MPTKRLLIGFGIGVAAVAIAVAAMLYMQRGAHIELKGSLKKVRTLALDENSSVAVVDFRFANPSDYSFMVRRVEVTVTGANGNTYDGMIISEVDAKRMFEYYKNLGQKFNDSLLMRDNIPARTSEDRMIAARFEMPESQLQARKNLVIRIEEVNGPTSELAEKP